MNIKFFSRSALAGLGLLAAAEVASAQNRPLPSDTLVTAPLGNTENDFAEYHQQLRVTLNGLVLNSGPLFRQGATRNMRAKDIPLAIVDSMARYDPEEHRSIFQTIIDLLSVMTEKGPDGRFLYEKLNNQEAVRDLFRDVRWALGYAAPAGSIVFGLAVEVQDNTEVRLPFYPALFALENAAIAAGIAPAQKKRSCRDLGHPRTPRVAPFCR
jgi:hypothetical protein